MEVLSLFPLIRGETTQKGDVTTPEPHRKGHRAPACLIACLSPKRETHGTTGKLQSQHKEYSMTLHPGIKEGCLEEGACELELDGNIRGLLGKTEKEEHSSVSPGVHSTSIH